MQKIKTYCPKCSFEIRIPSTKVIKFQCPNCTSQLHAHNGTISYQLVDRIFNLQDGWVNKPPMRVELKFLNLYPYYEISIDKVRIGVSQTDDRNGSYIHFIAELEGLKADNLKTLLQLNRDLGGLISYGIGNKNILTLQSAFPIAKSTSTANAREQTLISIGIMSQFAFDLYENSPTKGVDWKLAGNVAELVGRLIKGSLGV